MLTAHRLQLIAITLCVLAATPSSVGAARSCCLSGLGFGMPTTTEITWPTAPERPRVRFLGSMRSEADLGKPAGGFARMRNMMTGTKTTKIIAVQRPYDAYVDAAQRLYVTDGARRAVVMFDPATNKVRPGLDQVRHVVGISTYGSTQTAMRIFHDAGRRTILRSVRLLAPLRRCRSTWLGLYGMDRASDADRNAFLTRVASAMQGLR